MCGIAGFIDHNKVLSISNLRDMVNSLEHRGPDDKGIAIMNMNDTNIGFGHTRLSIIDLTIMANQPMQYDNLTITFNGEIYNYKELRKELQKLGNTFNTQSDTEVVLKAFKQWNVKSIDKFIGMFSFALFDKTTGILLLCRDRAGVKPLYYNVTNTGLLFASELKALYTIPFFTKELNTKTLGNYFQLGYIPAPNTIFENTFKLKPGHYLTYNINNRYYETTQYWSLEEYFLKPKFNISNEEAKHELNELLISAFKYRLVADVPVGVFLSSGYDSTAVTAILQRNSTSKLKTFTIGFNEGNDESKNAKIISQYLETDHNEYICTKKDAQDIIPILPYFYDEPFADSSAIPTILVSRFAKQYVKVALSADAGDELFGGYIHYLKYKKYLAYYGKIPAFTKHIIKLILEKSSFIFPNEKYNIRHKTHAIYKSLNKNKTIQNRLLLKYMNVLPTKYYKLFKKDLTFYDSPFEINKQYNIDELENAMLIDYKNYLTDDILTKVDRATMSTSLEGREPFLDHRIAEYTARMPMSFKINETTGKLILKNIVHQYIPENIMNRPKMGFSIPIKSWLQSELSYLVCDYLSESALNKSGLFNENFVRTQISLFKKNKLYNTPFIWKILMFQMWYFKWMK